MGELAFLFDSIQPQAVYHDMTSRQLLETWLNIHNSQVEDKKKFYVGMVTVHDSNDSMYRFTNQETTLDCIRDKLCDSLADTSGSERWTGNVISTWYLFRNMGRFANSPLSSVKTCWTTVRMSLHRTCIPV